jgi:Asp-tRNA(Asn)/Glu-tRNA(Gln) amidotransferase A subunit family amidase
VRDGLKMTPLDFAAAEQRRQEVFHRFRKLFERFDVLLTPAAPVKPIRRTNPPDRVKFDADFRHVPSS